MSAFERILKAKSLLGLGERASLQEIKIRYKTLMAQWHPDKHPQNPQQAHEKAVMINDAYETVLAYVNDYEYAFDEESLKRKTLSAHEWWHEHFNPNGGGTKP